MNEPELTIAMLNDEILEEYINGFYGYGDLNAPLWFVGMEEGGGNSVGEINKRIEVWKNRGSQETEDLFDYDCKIGITQFFGQRAKLQTTWNKLIRIVLSTRDDKFDIENIRDYQNRFLARKSSETCILELLPLPSPSTTEWLYGDHSKIYYLRNRDTYRNVVVKFRVPFIRTKLLEYMPKAVVFYGSGYKDYWTEIAGIDSFTDIKYGIRFQKKGETTFICSQHPASKGITSEYFHRIGQLIKEETVL